MNHQRLVQLQQTRGDRTAIAHSRNSGNRLYDIDSDECHNDLRASVDRKAQTVQPSIPSQDGCCTRGTMGKTEARFRTSANCKRKTKRKIECKRLKTHWSGSGKRWALKKAVAKKAA
jgi:hypothetical protein